MVKEKGGNSELKKFFNWVALFLYWLYFSIIKWRRLAIRFIWSLEKEYDSLKVVISIEHDCQSPLIGNDAKKAVNLIGAKDYNLSKVSQIYWDKNINYRTKRSLWFSGYRWPIAIYVVCFIGPTQKSNKKKPSNSLACGDKCQDEICLETSNSFHVCIVLTFKMSWVKKNAGCYLRNSFRWWDKLILVDSVHLGTMRVKRKRETKRNQGFPSDCLQVLFWFTWSTHYYQI